jgi:hypothetical protein
MFSSRIFTEIIKKEELLYNVTVLDQFWTPIVPCYSTEDAFRIVNSFVTIPITRNYIHSQLFLMLLHMYSLQSLIRS